jgi:hypothetical protein
MVRPPQVPEVVSLTVTLNEQEPVFPALSVAVQFTVVVPRPKVEPDAGAQVGVRVPSQLSVAVAVNVTLADIEHAAAVTVLSPGQTTTGFSQSFTVTQNEQTPVFPALSVAVQVTLVVPTLKVEPDAGVQVGVRLPSQLSVAEALKVTTAPHTPLSLHWVIGPGQLTTGFSQSFTVTQNEQEPVFPALSVAVQVTLVVPTLKVEPDTGVQVGVRLPSQLSVAEALKVTTAPHTPLSLHWVIGPGQLTTGFSESVTVMLKLHDEVLGEVAESEAVQLTVVVPTGKESPDFTTVPF